MSALPSSLPFGWEGIVKEAVNAHLFNIGLTPECIHASQSGLSVEEVRLIPESAFKTRRERLPVGDIDVKVTLPDGFYGEATFNVWGTFHKATRGQREDGVPIEPDTPPYFEVDRVCWGDDEITGSIDQDLMDGIADYMLHHYAPNGSDE